MKCSGCDVSGQDEVEATLRYDTKRNDTISRSVVEATSASASADACRHWTKCEYEQRAWLHVRARRRARRAATARRWARRALLAVAASATLFAINTAVSAHSVAVCLSCVFCTITILRTVRTFNGC